MLYKSFKYALRGIVKTLFSQRNFCIMTACFLLVVIAGFIFEISRLEWAVIFLCCGSVLGFEMLNTSIECVVDIIKPELHPKAERAKDVAAGSVLVLSVFAVVIGLIIFIPHITELFE